MHRYLDEDPGAADGVREVDRASLLALRDRVSDDDWWESSFDEALDDPGTVAFATDGGGAVLTVLDGAPRNVGLLVAAEARGRGVGTALGRAAASYAVRHHGYARWRSRDANVASSRAAARLGFEPYVTQLAVRLGAQAWIVTGLYDGRVVSNVEMSSSWLSVMPTSSRPLSSRQRV